MPWILAVLLAVTGRVVFAFADPAIVESSGLVDFGSVMVTMNDSGGAPVVYLVDPVSGRTVGVTRYATGVRDVEALAPAADHDPGVVWVGDIGDNDRVRSSVQVYRVPIAPGIREVSAPRYDLVYSDGPHDAEALVVGPGGRLFVITKSMLGGGVYATSGRPVAGAENRLTPFRGIGLFVTDAALFPDGEHVLVRGYRSAVVTTFPGFEPVAWMSLPEQRQGEGVSISPAGRIRLSSEGLHSEVLQIRLPADVRTAMAAPRVPESPGPIPPPRDRYGGPETDPRPWVAILALLAVLGIAGTRTGWGVWRWWRRRRGAR